MLRRIQDPVSRSSTGISDLCVISASNVLGVREPRCDGDCTILPVKKLQMYRLFESSHRVYCLWLSVSDHLESLDLPSDSRSSPTARGG